MSSLWKDSVTPEDGIWKPKYLLSTTKAAYNALEHLLDIFHVQSATVYTALSFNILN
jgi:hypothetical protein